jgi:predicted nucleic acid-binding protein
MNVLVDTTIWSLALRRARRPSNELEEARSIELAELIREGRAIIIGPIRQELLSGVVEARPFELLRQKLAAFPDLPIVSLDYETAAQFYNRCRSKGIQGSHVDFLICAVAWRGQLPIFTSDGDFTQYAKVLPVGLHQPRK